MDQSDNQSQSNALQSLLSAAQKDQLFVDLGLADIPQENKDSLMSSMIDNLIGRILNRIAPILTDDDLNRLDELLQKEGADEEVSQFLREKVPNLDAVAAEETERFKMEMKESVDIIKDSLQQS